MMTGGDLVADLFSGWTSRTASPPGHPAASHRTVKNALISKLETITDTTPAAITGILNASEDPTGSDSPQLPMGAES